MGARDGSGASSKVVLLGLAAGITATIVAWGVLVLAAIDFGRDARGGATQSWYLLAGATVGAVACMFLAIIFAARLQARLKGEQPVRRTSVAAEDSVRAGDVAEVTSVAASVTPAPDGEPPTYRSKHSRAAEGPEPEESLDSPAAAYRGKRAAR